MRRRLFRTALFSAAALATSCSSAGSATTSSTAAVKVSIETSMPTSATSVISPVSDPPPTVAPGVVLGLELSVGGVGDIAFGATPDVAIGVLSAALGAPISDLAANFPTLIDGLSVDVEAELGFAHPAARRVCWTALCAFFGGDDLAAMVFVGWDLSQTPAVSLATVEGITVGTRWIDVVASMSVEPGGCPTSGFGSTLSGVELRVVGGAFSRTDEDGEYVELLPSPTEVTVVGLAAGSRIIDLEQGC